MNPKGISIMTKKNQTGGINAIANKIIFQFRRIASITARHQVSKT